jgi:hypothetical protein
MRHYYNIKCRKNSFLMNTHLEVTSFYIKVQHKYGIYSDFLLVLQYMRSVQ